jgi:hypothetical protein
MKFLKLKFKWLFVLAAVLLLTAGVSLAVEDTYYVEVDTTGQVISGGGSGYNGGMWYYYPLTDWWNQWFYNAPYDENRRKEMSVSLTIQPLDRQFPGFAEIAYNWSTGDWSALGNNRPPLPTDFTSPDIEDKYIRRSTFYTGTFTGIQQITDRFEIPDYNPEWVSIDLRGENFQIVEGDGWINHRCLPKVNPEIKWLQAPDKTKNGIDIRCDRLDGLSRVMADDFLCESPGAITRVVLWGSWKNDIKGRVKKIHLSIHKDIPDPEPGDPATYSKPGGELWSMNVVPLEYLHYDIGPEEYEWWWDPLGDVDPDPQGDQKIWRYEMDIDPCDAFYQEGTEDNPIVYWLDVYAILDPCVPGPGTEGAQFGWKTSEKHWNDDAVFRGDDDVWHELRYPFIHPSYPNSIDMAFMIATTVEPEPNELKWSQPPVPWPQAANTYIGWDEESHNLLPIMVADDFFCDSNRPVTAIRWWGSFEGYNDDVVPEGSVPDYFYITIWDDIPASADVNYSRPNEVIWENYCRTFDVSYFGQEFDPRTGATNLSKFMFEQELKPSDYWYQPNDNGVYWLGIMAVYEDAAAPPMFPWGWETRKHFYNDDAVRIFADPRKGDWPYPADRIEPIKLDFVTWDLSFELLTRGRACWECPFWALGDINGDGYVTAGDVGPIINYFGQTTSAYPCADLNGDGYITAGDVGPIINNFGAGDGNACPP